MPILKPPTTLVAPTSGNVWFSADQHFCHANIIDYCARPFSSVDAMNEALVVNWNARVALGDTVYVLGDFGLGKPESILPWRARMNGTVVLIRGNHDRIGKGYAAALNMQVVNGDAELTLEGVTFHLSHYPRPLSEKIPGRTHLFGHVHGRYRVRDGMLNVGVDVWGFRPITPEEALLALKE